MKLTIYMKSGNAITITSVYEYKIENRGNDIVGITLIQKRRLFNIFPQNKLLVKTLDLSQVEAIVVAD